MENTQIQDNGPLENTVEEAQSTEAQFDVNNISGAIENLLFGSEQEQQPEGSQETGEVQTEDKAEETATQEYESPQAEDGEDQVHSQTEETVTEEEVLPNGVQKRINKLTARNKAYEEQISEMALKLQELEVKVNKEGQVQKTEAPRPMPENPFGHLDTPEKIQAEVENARWLRYKCEENPDGFELGGSYIGPEEVRTIKVNAIKAIEQNLPAQYQYLQAAKHYGEIASKEYPWWTKPETKEAQMANEVLKNFPQFRKFPDFQLFVGDYVRGYMSRTGTSKAVAPFAKAAPAMSVKPRTAPSQVARREVADKSTYDRFVKSGGKEGLAKLLLQKGII
jgi:hypothetical protein